MHRVEHRGGRSGEASADGRRTAWRQLVQRWSWHETTALLHQLWARERERARDAGDYERARRRVNFAVTVVRLREQGTVQRNQLSTGQPGEGGDATR